MMQRHRVVLLLMLSVAVPVAGDPCEDVTWDRLVEAMVRGNEGTIATLIGSGRLSLRLDGISQGRYTAPQARRLLGDFFRRTDTRSLAYGTCESGGNRAWAQATYRYRHSETGRTTEERLLLEWCVVGQDGLLSGIRSVSVGSSEAILRNDGTK
jgi:hypothetical protein